MAALTYALLHILIGFRLVVFRVSHAADLHMLAIVRITRGMTTRARSRVLNETPHATNIEVCKAAGGIIEHLKLGPEDLSKLGASRGAIRPSLIVGHIARHSAVNAKLVRCLGHWFVSKG